MAESPTLVSKALWCITNILQEDSHDITRPITHECGGEVFQKCLDVLVHSNDSLVHINALPLVTGFILKPNEDVLVHQIEQQNPLILEGLLKRGLKSCSSSYKCLDSSLQAIVRLIELDMQDHDTGDIEKRFVPRLLAADGIHLLEEA